ncbi:MAG TPA: pantetheine-phosphate adenylyltransferase [Euryarchaeota archaeon]|nr:phosphopantetheine adenylyltransferase [archaeon BMS3Bbin15]HDL15293.1 pantetheine-phosphate adenylyltransferase [Euryarchaeota archaeon]
MYHFKSAVAGTFDVLHKGHRVLIEEAFKRGEFVLVGITKDGFKEAKPMKVRKRNLDKLLRARYPERYEIVEIEDELGPAVVNPDLDALIVSEETYSKAAVINKLRKEKGLKKLVIYKISMVLAADGKPISSLRINKGEIDKEGNLLK